MKGAGLLNRRVMLEEPVRNADASGGAAVSWKQTARLWAHIKPLSGRERLQHEKTTSRVTHEVAIRYRKGLSPAMRFNDGGRVYAIHTVLDPDQTRCWHHCRCSEVQL